MDNLENTNEVSLKNWNKWEHLFLKGEYGSRERILSNLTLEQVTELPPGMKHSIYDELWHTVKWQNFVIQEETNEDEYQTWEKGESRFPSEIPKSEDEWIALVENFFAGLKKIIEYTRTHEDLRKEVEEGVNIEDSLCCLSIHNAYHLGKIVAIRQMIGAWPSKDHE